MCDYVFTQKTPDQGIIRITESYCQRAPQFWVQSLLSTHNAHACPHHLARIVREIDECARQFDITTVHKVPDMRYARRSQSGAHMKMTKEESNYARVTVKPYTRKVN